MRTAPSRLLTPGALGALIVLCGSAAPLAAAATAASTPATPPPASPRRESTASARRDVSVTAYNNNLALVKEVRDLSDLPKGTFDLWFEDVPSLINPRTVSLRSLAPSGGSAGGAGNGAAPVSTDDIRILEQNYEFDLISPERLLEKSVGADLDLVETSDGLQDRVTRAKLLSTNGGNVFQIGDRVSLGHPGRIVLQTLPGGLFARPTLVWKLSNDGPAAQPVEASYLTDGISWSADYVAVADASTTRFDLTGWITLVNQSGAAYEDARLKLVAGDVQRVRQSMTDMAMMRAPKTMAAEAAFESENFFEYHLYTLERRTDIRQNQTKQIQLFSAAGVPVRKRLVVEGTPYIYSQNLRPQNSIDTVSVLVEMKNDKAGNLGMPIPAGVVRVYQRDRDGALQFAGEDQIKHTPKDETITLRLGSAFDVVAERVQTDWKKINVLPYDAEAAIEVRLRNHKDEAVTVTVRENLPQAEWKLMEQSVPGKKISSTQVEFEVPVPAGGETVLRYRVALKS